ncbi:MAG: hypothetical protein RLY27_2096, partial [Pseudomonadota bacterium]
LIEVAKDSGLELTSENKIIPDGLS